MPDALRGSTGPTRLHRLRRPAPSGPRRAAAGSRRPRTRRPSRPRPADCGCDTDRTTRLPPAWVAAIIGAPAACLRSRACVYAIAEMRPHGRTTVLLFVFFQALYALTSSGNAFRVPDEFEPY